MFKFKDGQIIIDTKEIKEAVKKAAGTAKDKLGEAKTLVVDKYHDVKETSGEQTYDKRDEKIENLYKELERLEEERRVDDILGEKEALAQIVKEFAEKQAKQHGAYEFGQEHDELEKECDQFGKCFEPDHCRHENGCCHKPTEEKTKTNQEMLETLISGIKEKVTGDKVDEFISELKAHVAEKTFDFASSLEKGKAIFKENADKIKAKANDAFATEKPTAQMGDEDTDSPADAPQDLIFTEIRFTPEDRHIVFTFEIADDLPDLPLVTLNELVTHLLLDAISKEFNGGRLNFSEIDFAGIELDFNGVTPNKTVIDYAEFIVLTNTGVKPQLKY